MYIGMGIGYDIMIIVNGKIDTTKHANTLQRASKLRKYNVSSIASRMAQKS